MLLLNFDAEYGPLLKGYGHYSGIATPVDLYWLPRKNGGGINNCEIDGFSINGGAPAVFWAGIEGKLSDIYAYGCLTGASYYRDAFLHSASRLNFIVFGDDNNVNGTAAKAGITHTGASTGLAVFDTVNVNGGAFGIYDYCPGSKYLNLIVTPENGTLWAHVAYHAGDYEQVNLDVFGIDIESATALLEGGVLLVGIRSAYMNGGLWVKNFAEASLPAIAVVANTTGDSITLQDCFFTATNGATLIQQIGAGRASIVLNNCRKFPASDTYTLSNVLTNIVSVGGFFGGDGHIIQGTP
jgi:hypothetical protein